MAAITTIALVAGAAALAGTATMGGLQYAESRKARKKSESVEKERKSQLDAESRARAAAAKQAETVGQRFGRSPSLFAGTPGFGTGDKQRGIGLGNLFGN